MSHGTSFPTMWYVRPAKAQTSLLEYSISVELPNDHHLEYLSLNVAYTGSSDSILVKMSHCRKSHFMAHMVSMPLHIKLAITFTSL